LDTITIQPGNCAQFRWWTDLRRPLFADVNMARRVLKCLLNDQTLEQMRLRAFTLMPDHFHFLAGVRNPEKKLPNLIGFFKSYTTQQYRKRSREIVNSGEVILLRLVWRKQRQRNRAL
jgi:REP element-mobilizing transposase RayT